MAYNGVIHTLYAAMFSSSLSKLEEDSGASALALSDTTTIISTTGESASDSTLVDDYMECFVDKYGCYCCATKYHYPACVFISTVRRNITK